ncbi:MAG: threonylcarbamoyl-AMP synthase [Chloroflexi bacterium]|nr:threonylcarbamoyl-AMP synthase [Chloroflexota bacterium]
MERAIAALKRGELVAFPTDTVYGIAALGSDDRAVARLYQVKQRPLDKAIPLFLARTDDLPQVAADISPAAWRLARRFWPGPLTMVLKKAPSVSSLVTAGGETVAVRVPDHPVALALVEGVGGPLAVTSANISGAGSVATAEEVAGQLGGHVELVIDVGPVPMGKESTIVDVSGERAVLLREGALSWQEVLEVCEGKSA